MKRSLRFISILMFLFVLLLAAGCGPINEYRANSAYQKGVELEQQGQDGAALQAYAEAVGFNPLHFDALYAHGLLSFEAGDLQQAGSDFEQALTVNSEHAEAHYHAALIHIQGEDWPSALDDLDPVIRLDPQKADAFYQRALILQAQGEAEKALPDFEQAAELDGENIDALYQSGLIYQQQEQTEKAIEVIGKALEMDNNLPGGHYQLALAYLESDQADKALSELEEAGKQDLQNADLFYRRGLLYIEKQDPAKALTDFSQTLIIDPQHGPAAYQRALIYIGQGTMDKALTHLDIAVEQAEALEPVQAADAYYQRALIYVQQTDAEAALADFAQVEQLAPEHTDLYLQRGQFYYNQGEFEEALADFDRLLELQPEEPDALYQRARALYALGKQTEALEALTNALKQKNSFKEARYLQGVIQMERGNLDRAIDAFSQVLRLDARDYEALLARARAYNQQHKYDEAAKDAKRLIDRPALEEAARYEAGYAAWLSGDAPKALRHFQKYLELNPQAENADQVSNWITYIQAEVDGESILDLESITLSLDELPLGFTGTNTGSRVRELESILTEDDLEASYVALYTSSIDKEDIEIMIVHLPDEDKRETFMGQAFGLIFWLSLDDVQQNDLVDGESLSIDRPGAEVSALWFESRRARGIRTEVLYYSRGVVGFVVLHHYRVGEEPLVKLEDTVKLLDERVMTMLLPE